MPLVEVTLGAGRTPEQVRAMIREVHAAVLHTVDTEPQHIRVIVHEVARSNWATGDVTLAEMDRQHARPATEPVEAPPQSEESP